MRIGMAISLLEAVKNGDEKAAKSILRQQQCSNLDKQSPRKDGTALFWSCCQGFLDVVNLLLLRGADVNLATGWGASPVHASVDNNQVEILALLIQFGANINKQTRNGDTPCHLAAYRGYGDCVQLLAERGANILIRNNKRKTPLQEAETGGHYEISRYLQAVQNLSEGSSLDERSMSIPYTSVQTVTSSTGYEHYPLNTFPSLNYFSPEDPRKAPCQLRGEINTHSGDTSHGISQSRSQSQNGSYSNYLTSSDTSSLSYQSENGLYSSDGQSRSSSISTNSSSSSSFGLNIDCDKRDLVGVLRLRSLDSQSDSYTNNLSSIDSSVVSSSGTAKPSLTFRNI